MQPAWRQTTCFQYQDGFTNRLRRFLGGSVIQYFVLTASELSTSVLGPLNHERADSHQAVTAVIRMTPRTAGAKLMFAKVMGYSPGSMKMAEANNNQRVATTPTTALHLRNKGKVSSTQHALGYGVVLQVQRHVHKQQRTASPSLCYASHSDECKGCCVTLIPASVFKTRNGCIRVDTWSIQLLALKGRSSQTRGQPAKKEHKK